MIRTTKDDSTGVLIVEPGTERLTAANATQFKEDVVACIDAGENMLVIDLSQTGFVDSSGIGALVGVLKRLGNRGLVRADVVLREWDDFYGERTNLDTGQVQHTHVHLPIPTSYHQRHRIL